MILLKQTVTIKRKADRDAWGIALNEALGTAYKCRIDFVNGLIKDKHGKEVTTKAEIILKGLVNITCSDLLTWIDEFKVTYSFNPIQVEVIRDISGRPIFTKVVV